MQLPLSHTLSHAASNLLLERTGRRYVGPQSEPKRNRPINCGLFLCRLGSPTVESHAKRTLVAAHMTMRIEKARNIILTFHEPFETRLYS